MKRSTRKRFTDADIKKLADEGRVKENPTGKLPKGAGDNVNWIDYNLSIFCKENSLTLRREYHFHEIRGWRSDWFIEELTTAIEYEGVYSEKSGHTTIQGFTGDTEKYNEYSIMGIRCIRYTATTYRNVLRDLRKIVLEVSK